MFSAACEEAGEVRDEIIASDGGEVVSDEQQRKVKRACVVGRLELFPHGQKCMYSATLSSCRSVSTGLRTREVRLEGDGTEHGPGQKVDSSPGRLS